MNKDLNSLSNEELKARKEELESEYNESKFIVREYMQKLLELKDEYDAIVDVIRKRNGGANAD